MNLCASTEPHEGVNVKAKARQMPIQEIKIYLLQIIEEWTGSDIPEEGEEDFDTLRDMHSWVESIETIGEVIDFLEGQGIDPEDWFGNLDLVYPTSDSGLSAKAATSRS